LVVILTIGLAANWVWRPAAAGPRQHEEHPPGTAIEYRVERPDATTHRYFQDAFTATQFAILEKLNRADAEHLGQLEQLVIPTTWHDERQYSPFPLTYRTAAHTPKVLIVDLRSQAFAAYEEGRLARWGPVSSGRQASPTPSGRFHLNWRSAGRHSTANPQWFMKWYFNFENAWGFSLHGHTLPGYPASHACIRLLERDAVWIYEWGDGWTLTTRGVITTQGTPLIVVGQYEFAAPPPWMSLAHLAQGITLPQ
jgi:hypothetical protein